MKFVFRIAFAAVVLSGLLIANSAEAETQKRVVELNAPVINDKEVKVECVHTYPHMILRSKIKETATFTITSAARVARTDCKIESPGRYVVPAGQRCTAFFHRDDAGKNITQVSAETATTRYAFRGNWPVYACCRGKFEDKELDESKGQHSRETFTDIIVDLDNKKYKSGTLYRGYEITLYPERVDSHNREKDSDNPFSENIKFQGRQFLKGPCAADDK